ncbi:MAG: OmpH family outer membrane protein [Deltaproteobacteria bacterium]|nr:OmpH family outer membrane protein [Deltaproteobacteria bacterium]
MRFAFFSIFTLVFFSFSVFAQQVNIGYVDLQRVMLESEKGKEAKKTLTEEANKMKKSLDAKQEELQKMKDALERQGATITPEARAEKEKQYQSKLRDYQRAYSDYQAELQQKDMELTQGILKEIEEVIKVLGEKEKFTIIFEKNQAGILFATPAIDITDKVIKQYNEMTKKQTPKK